MGKNNNSNFFIRRFHSLIALIPIGIFLCVHLVLNSSVLLANGNESYLAVIHFMKTAPFVAILELVIIALPILFHAIYGIYVVYVAKNNLLRYKYLRNWNFFLQRATALVVLLFLVWHVITLRFLQHEAVDILAALSTYLHNPLFLALYIFGVVCSIYHFANGLFTFCITWGICVGPKAQRIFSFVAALIFLALAVLACSILIKISILPIPM